MVLLSDAEYIAEVRERIKTATFLEAVVSFDYCRAKFECLTKGGTRYHLHLRIVSSAKDDYLGVNMDMPRTTMSIRTNHPFFHKLKERVVNLAPAPCED